MKIIGAKAALVANRIRTRRHELGMSQENLKKKANIRQMRISDIERQSTSPTNEELEKLAAALDVSVQWLRTGRE